MLVKPIPDGYNSLTPYMIVKHASQAIEFYKQAFNAKERMRLDSPNGAIGHAELIIGDSLIMLADEFPEMGAKSPQTLGGSPITMHLYVLNVDEVVARALDAGAKLVRPVANQFYGDRSGAVQDPFGHTWHISTHIEDVSGEEIKRRSKEMKG